MIIFPPALSLRWDSDPHENVSVVPYVHFYHPLHVYVWLVLTSLMYQNEKINFNINKFKIRFEEYGVVCNPKNEEHREEKWMADDKCSEWLQYVEGRNDKNLYVTYTHKIMR